VFREYEQASTTSIKNKDQEQRSRTKIKNKDQEQRSRTKIKNKDQEQRSRTKIKNKDQEQASRDKPQADFHGSSDARKSWRETGPSKKASYPIVAGVTFYTPRIRVAASAR
jgi:hypothetical protein